MNDCIHYHACIYKFNYLYINLLKQLSAPDLETGEETHLTMKTKVDESGLC